jgi:hypothetical protein
MRTSPVGHSENFAFHKFSEVHIQHPAYLRPYETGGWPIATPECRRAPTRCGVLNNYAPRCNIGNTKRSELRFRTVLDGSLREVRFEPVLRTHRPSGKSNSRTFPLYGILRSSLTAWLRNAFRNVQQTVVL